MAAMWAVACGGDGGIEPEPLPQPNRPPVATGSLPAQTMTAGESAQVNVAPFFSDPDGDPLTYTATISNTAVATVSVSGSLLTVSAVAAGTATVAVTATDLGGLAASASANVTVVEPNRPPSALLPVAPQQTADVGDTITVDVSPFFTDPDGDPLTYTASSANTSVATVAVTGSVVSGAAIRTGSTTLTVTATDPEGLSASLSVPITVIQPNRPPTALVSQIDPDTLIVGDSVSQDVAPNFVDPDGDPLSYSVSSNDTNVATVSLSNSIATARAVGVGTATVTITATDPAGLSVSISGLLTVEREPNRPPAATVSALPPQSLQAGGSVDQDVSAFFTDPDGDALTYAAVSSNVAIATASVAGSTVTVAGVAEGMATVTVTASDPGNLTASLNMNVTVTAGGGGTSGAVLRDDFDNSGSLSDWELRGAATASVSGGVLRLNNTRDDRTARAARSLGSVITEWEVSARMGRVQTGSGHTAAVVLRTGDSRISTILLEVGSPHTSGPTNYRLQVYNADQSSWVTVDSGRSSAINEGSGQFTEIEIRLRNGVMRAMAGNATLYEDDVEGTFPAAIEEVELWALRPLLRQADHTALFDWIEVRGGSGGSSNRSPVAVGTIPSRTMTTGETATVDVAAFFSDPDGDPLTYAAGTSNAGVATVSVSGSTLTIMAVAAGTAAVTVTARDPHGREATQTISVSVDGGGGSTYGTGETITTLPTGSWTPNLLVGGVTVTSVAGQTHVTFDNGAFIVYQGVTYTCIASGGCRIEGRTVTRGTIRATGGGGSNQAPDLIVESPSVNDASPAAGASFTLSVTVRNRGDAQSNATTLRYFRSSNETISASDEEVGTDAVGGLAASGTSEESIDLTAPTTAGTYHYGACVDSIAQESDGDNNCSRAVTITVGDGGQTPPTRNARASLSREGSGIRIRWPPVSRATFYKVNYCWGLVPAGVCNMTSDYRVVANEVTDTTYLHTNPHRGPPGLPTFHFYIVQACNSGGCSSLTSGSAAPMSWGQPSEAAPGHLRQRSRPPPPTIAGADHSIQAQSQTTGARIQWLSFGRWLTPGRDHNGTDPDRGGM